MAGIFLMVSILMIYKLFGFEVAVILALTIICGLKVNDDYNLYNLIYDHDLFIYPFDNQEIPNFIGEVPIITDIKVAPGKKMLDSIYSKYCEKVGNRKVEGIVINCNNLISKYVRMKNGKLIEYSDNDHKGILGNKGE